MVCRCARSTPGKACNSFHAFNLATADASFGGVPYSVGDKEYGISHMGFTAIWRDLGVFEAVSALQTAHPALTRVVFTGHSLGGAVAQLVALEWALRRTSYVVCAGNEHVRHFLSRPET